MDESYQKAYGALNSQQKQAVDTIDGPLLVIAGPGTGKTQLLSLRVANILRLTDAAPNNVLCLTFTDNASRNMRERLQSIIGQPAYHVSINTFHSFGGEVISQYPDYFTSRRMLQPIDEMGRYEIGQQIFEQLPHSNPMSAKVGEDYIFLKDCLQVISWLKQNALTPSELRDLLAANQVFFDTINDQLVKIFTTPTSPKQLNSYKQLLTAIEACSRNQLSYGFLDYAGTCASSLSQAIDETPIDGRYAKSITAWRNKWCQKNVAGEHMLKDSGRAIEKMFAVADIYEQLIANMTAAGLYDFDDMIIEVVHALEKDDELRLQLQERYQYVLVDEFQDTNKAQFRMLAALGNNSVNEGRPNLMAVGDDDQAIYAFQGAEASNMANFVHLYNKPEIISLVSNYRSTQTILDASSIISSQISDRLETILDDRPKHLIAEQTYPKSILDRQVFLSELAQYQWLANKIDSYLQAGMEPAQIAVIAPRHRYLERLMPYIVNRFPVAYERREDILQTPIIMQLLNMAQLVIAIGTNQQADINNLFGQVLVYDFWGLSNQTVVQISLDCYNNRTDWLPTLLAHPDTYVQSIAEWFIDLTRRASLEPLEYMLDRLVGGIGDEGKLDSEFEELSSEVEQIEAKHSFTSPIREYYFSVNNYQHAPDTYLGLLGKLSTLRQSLREWRPGKLLFLSDLINFTQLHQTAGLKIIDTNPHTQSTNAVQVMTAYKAKGLEFDVVFVINAQDEIWGTTARKNSRSIRLPNNLPIAPASDDDNDRLRLLFVAMTRARRNLHITGYTHSLSNKLSPELSYLIDETASVRHESFTAHQNDHPAIEQAVTLLSTDWSYRLRQVITDKPTLFEPILANYKLSVTHLNNFLDVEKDGPNYFLVHNLLRFPEAASPAAAYGDAIHRVLQWAHIKLREQQQLPDIQNIQDYFIDLLSRKQLKISDYKRLSQRGIKALEIYFSARGNYFNASDLLERSFSNEGVIINGAHLSGKIDKMHFVSASRVEVVDFKTGKPASSWKTSNEFEKAKLHRYSQQLLFYKLLVENSASYANKAIVSSGSLEFIETNDQNKLVDNLDLTFTDASTTHLGKLIEAVWRHIENLDFPDVSGYSPNFSGILKFEQDLVDGKI